MTFEASSLQHRFIKLRENKLFETFVIFVIIFSALLIGAKTYDIPAGTLAFLHALDWAVTLFFLAEILVRMVAEGSLRAFFRKGWNVFDFVIVVASLVQYCFHRRPLHKQWRHINTHFGDLSSQGLQIAMLLPELSCNLVSHHIRP